MLTSRMVLCLLVVEQKSWIAAKCKFYLLSNLSDVTDLTTSDNYFSLDLKRAVQEKRYGVSVDSIIETQTYNKVYNKLLHEEVSKCKLLRSKTFQPILEYTVLEAV